MLTTAHRPNTAVVSHAHLSRDEGPATLATSVTMAEVSTDRTNIEPM